MHEMEYNTLVYCTALKEIFFIIHLFATLVQSCK